MASHTIVVVGGALSGPTAAARAREVDPRARIIVLERGPAVSYAVGGLAYHVSGEVASLQALNREQAEIFRGAARIEARTGVHVRRIDTAKHTVEADGQTLAYDRLVFAAGAESVVPDVAGLDGADNVFRFRTLDDLKRITATLKRGARHITILGGGYFGIEAADGFLRRRCRVTIVEKAPHILSRHSTSMAALATAALEAAGATVVTGTSAASVIRKGSRVTSVVLAGGRAIKTDLVIVATGLRPRTGLLRDAGARLLADGTVPIDSHAATSLPDVFACGVCVSVPRAPSGEHMWIPQAAVADKTAQVAGIRAAGGEARIEPLLGTAIVRAGVLTVARTGVTDGEAGPGSATVAANAMSHDRFFPDAAPMSIALTYETGSGRVLGAEIAGRAGVDKRIDVVATAVAGGLTIEQLAALDLAYAPPYSAARDPLNLAAAEAAATRAVAAPPKGGRR